MRRKPVFDVTCRTTYYRPDLAWVHHRGFGFHADLCAPGILHWLEPVRKRGGLVVELGCGSGLLTRHLVEAGHRVIATDASPSMLDLAREYVPNVEEVRRITLPDDPIPAADAIVSVGHALSYLSDRPSIERSLLAVADALRPQGVMALDLCDLEWGQVRQDAPPSARIDEDWAIITQFAVPAPDRFVRFITTFVRSDDGTWRRDDERHDNVLVDTSVIPALLQPRGLNVSVNTSFGDERLPIGLRAIAGSRMA